MFTYNDEITARFNEWQIKNLHQWVYKTNLQISINNSGETILHSFQRGTIAELSPLSNLKTTSEPAREEHENVTVWWNK